MVSLSLYGKCNSCGKNFAKGESVVMTGNIAGIGRMIIQSGILENSSQKIYCKSCARRTINS